MTTDLSTFSSVINDSSLFSCLDPIEDSQLPRVGIVYGTSELHGAYDYHSFTEMLERLVRENNLSLQFTQISRYIIYMYDV